MVKYFKKLFVILAGIMLCAGTTVNATEMQEDVINEPDENCLEELDKSENQQYSELEESNNSISNLVPTEANMFAETYYKDLIEASLPYFPVLTSDDINQYELKSPYVVYDYDDNNPEIYYYPVTLNDNIVMVISIVETTEGYSISGSEEMVDGLNNIDYVSESNDIVFYENGCEIDAETENGIFLVEKIDEMQGEISEAPENFISMNISEKKEVVKESLKTTESLNLDYVQAVSEDNNIIEEVYSPAYSTNTSTNKTCKLYNAQGQGNLPICWAASVATVVNYRKGTSITAKNVCDVMNTGYVGATIDVKQNALKKYGLNYTKRNSQLTYNQIKTNINNKYPIAASTFEPGGGAHAITVYGWNMPKVTEFVIIWNSGTNSSQTMYYNPNGSTYTYNNKTWTWTKSLSYY